MMARKWISFKNWSVTAKLVTLFAIFGIVPMAAIGMIAFQAATDMKGKVGLRFQDTALMISDKIDRSLFERYGDVQVFTYNDVVTRLSNWGDESDTNAISLNMNKYVQAYGIYYLTMMVNTNGDLVAVNYKDAAGNPIDTSSLWKKNYRETPWFKALEAEQYTTKMPFTAPGNDVSTGTFIEDVHIDPDVKAAYPEDDALTIGFSAPVYDGDGQLLGFWTNRAKFSLVEEIFQQTYQELKAAGYPSAELTLLGDKGQVLVDYDPTRQGTEDITHDFENVLFKLNLAEKGVETAQRAVAGETGNLTALHARKQIQQAGGYTHLDGALGYPGMNWSVLVRIPETEAAAEALAIQQKVLVTALVCLGLLLPIGWYAGRKGAKQVQVIKDAAEKMSAGDYAARTMVQSQDEIGQLGEAFNTMASQIQENIEKEQENARVMARIKTAVDNVTTNVLMCDRSYTVTYQNNASRDTLKKYEHEIRKMFSGFDADKVVGSCIDAYHKNPSHQRKILDDPKNLPHRTEIQLGPLTLDLNASAIMSESGEYLGNVVEWADVTAQKKSQNEVERLIGAASAGQLSERIKSEELEGFFKVLANGVNRLLDQVANPLTEAQSVLTALSQGDLTKKMTGNYEGEFLKIKESLNLAIENLAQTVTVVREGADGVTTAAQEISRGNDDLSQRTSEQASSLEETSASMEEMTSTVKQNADNAKQANQLAIAAREVAEKGGQVTTDAVRAMDEINRSSKKIADIINVIDEIAFQTNLLALNAAVEAARAGEQGRGFAVVATEVRNLAQRSASAAKEIKDLINESVQKVSDGSDLVNQSGKTLDEIVNSVKRVTDIISEITAASQEQSTGIDQVNKAIMQMDQTTQQNAALVEEAASAAQSMQQQASALQREVAFFKTSINGYSESQGASEREAAAPSSAKPADSAPPQRASASPAPTSQQTFEPAGVGAGNGFEPRQWQDDAFEEF